MRAAVEQVVKEGIRFIVGRVRVECGGFVDGRGAEGRSTCFDHRGPPKTIFSAGGLSGGLSYFEQCEYREWW